jgi:hypothetical protein
MEASSIIFGGWNVTGANVSDWTSRDVYDGGSPYNYLPGNGVMRTTQVLPNDQVNVPNWTIGDRFNTKIENPMWNINAFAYPAAFTPGTLGRNTINGPHLVWSEASASMQIHVKEFATLEFRYDINNIFKNEFH